MELPYSRCLWPPSRSLVQGNKTLLRACKRLAQVMNEIMAAPDKGIPEEVLNGAKCIAVVPNMAKAHSSSAESMDAVWLPAALPMAGVHQHSFRLAGAILASRLAVSQSISSCCS